ncbi:MAG: cyclic nucleotide-binding domain-containing protein [Proteobacteria bacterium]|nr:cyclic nucleotide-binding domain-containing protein [Pseudomonadota bacterium]MBU0966273.1 cyclic nucleotide-binding domain-containing protein [Pseudomonadota bacterium]
MKGENRIQVLQQIDLFSSFSIADLQAFAFSIDEVHCQPGEILLCEGTAGEDFFVLLQGKLSVCKDKRILSEIVPVDYVGEMAIIEEKPRSATVKASEQSLLLKVPAKLFKGFLANNPQALLPIMKILSRRLREDNEVIVREFEQINILVHDMKNLLSLFLFLDNFPVEKGSSQDKYVRYMKMARNHITALVEQALASVKNLVVPEGFARNSLPALIHEMREADFVTHPVLQDKNIIVKLADDLPEFYFSKLQIRLVLLNLLINAAQASSPGAQIELSASVSGDRISIEVQDHGRGIAETVADKIFDAHFTTKATGNGLGLLSCKQIVEKKHGGSISFVSKPDEGTIFTVSLPLCWDGPAVPLHQTAQFN